MIQFSIREQKFKSDRNRNNGCPPAFNLQDDAAVWKHKLFPADVW